MKYQALILAGAAAAPFVSASAVPTRAALQKRVFPTGSADAAAFFSTVDPGQLEHLFSLANAGNAGFISHAQSFTSANAEQYSSYLAAKNIDPSEASAILGGIATRSADASGAQATGDGSSNADGNSSTGANGEGNSSDSGSATATGSDGASSAGASATDGASSAADGASSGAAGASSTGANAASSAASGASGVVSSATGAAASGTNGSGNGNGAVSLSGFSGLTNAGLVAIAGVVAGFVLV